MDNIKTEIEVKTSVDQNNNNSPQELSEEVLEKLDRMNKDTIESMVKSGYSRKEAESFANDFS
jgi:hypothetical protein